MRCDVLPIGLSNDVDQRLNLQLHKLAPTHAHMNSQKLITGLLKTDLSNFKIMGDTAAWVR